MKTKILLFVLIIIILFVVNYSPIEQFINTYNSNMLEFTRLDNSLIKKIKIGSSSSLYDQEVLNLFKNDDVIRINIPDNYTVRIIYKFKNESKGFGKTINLNTGSYDISKTIGNKIIYQIDISNIQGLNENINLNEIFIKDTNGEIIYSGPDYVPINWDLIYANYGYDNYYIYYPSSNVIKTNYYYNFPRYKMYKPSNRIIKERHNIYHKFKNKYNYRRKEQDNNFIHNMEPKQRIIYRNNDNMERKQRIHNLRKK